MNAVQAVLRINHLMPTRKGSYDMRRIKNVMPNIITVYRAHNGELLNSRPCDDCIKVMRYFGIKRVKYSTGDPVIPFVIEHLDEIEFHGPSKGNR